MRVVPTGQSEYHKGNEVLRYGRDMDNDTTVGVWYHDGVEVEERRLWAMDTDVEWKVSPSVKKLCVACQDGLYVIQRDDFRGRVRVIDGREQYVAMSTDAYVERLGHPRDTLRDYLWIDSGDEVDVGYHAEKGEA